MVDKKLKNYLRPDIVSYTGFIGLNGMGSDHLNESDNELHKTDEYKSLFNLFLKTATLTVPCNQSDSGRAIKLHILLIHRR